MLMLSKKEGKGWLATIIAGELNFNIVIPKYIVYALAFASQETMSLQIYVKMLNYSLALYDEKDARRYLDLLRNSRDNASLVETISEILEDIYLKDDVVFQFIDICEKYQRRLSDNDE